MRTEPCSNDYVKQRTRDRNVVTFEFGAHDLRPNADTRRRKRADAEHQHPGEVSETCFSFAGVEAKHVSVSIPARDRSAEGVTQRPAGTGGVERLHHFRGSRALAAPTAAIVVPDR